MNQFFFSYSVVHFRQEMFRNWENLFIFVSLKNVFSCWDKGILIKKCEGYIILKDICNIHTYFGFFSQNKTHLSKPE